jgi:hypothetical protein
MNALVFSEEYIDYAVSQGYTELQLADLEAMPTISESQTADLKIETEDERVWLERIGVSDGEWCDDKVTVEFLLNGRWCTIVEYEAK